MQEWFFNLLTDHQYLVYLVIVITGSFLGPILAVLCGIMIRLGELPFLPAYFALMAGDLLGDVTWYWIGHHSGHRFIRRFGEYFSITEKGVSTVTEIFHKYSTRILIISKMTMGFGFALATLFTAGMIRIPFKKYLFLNLVGQFVWTGILITVGYLFGQIYNTLDDVFARISLIGMVGIALLALFGFGKYMRKRISKAINS